MQNSIWKKGLVLEIIILFLGIGVLPSVSGKLMTLNTDHNNLNNSKTKITFIVIGKIEDIIYHSDYTYSFLIITGYAAEFINGKLVGVTSIIGSYLRFGFDSKIGIFKYNFVCAVFFNVFV
jgi:hypothetical protein